jgi:hypothetical protein
MNMERNEQSTDRLDEAENTLTEENVASESNPSRSHLKEIIKGLIQKILLVFTTLVRNAKSAYTRIFKDNGDVGPMEDIKGAFKHIPLKKKGLGYLLGGFIFSVYILSGVYTVEPGEVAVSRIFGQEVRQSISEGKFASQFPRDYIIDSPGRLRPLKK